MSLLSWFGNLNNTHEGLGTPQLAQGPRDWPLPRRGNNFSLLSLHIPPKVCAHKRLVNVPIVHDESSVPSGCVENLIMPRF